MKKIVIIILIGLLAYRGETQTVLSSNAYSQTAKKTNVKSSVEMSNIPMNAKQHFSSTHKNAETRTWNKDNEGGYSAVYKENGKEHTARYSKAGKWVSDERHLQEYNIPLPILEAFEQSKYHYGNIDTYSFVKNETYTRGVYVLTVTMNGKHTYLYYSAAGKLLRTF